MTSPQDFTDITHSTAYKAVDILLEDGIISEERAAHLKGDYKDLYDCVIQIYNHDNFLLKRARILRRELEMEKGKLENCGSTAKKDDSDIKQMKNLLILLEGELNTTQEEEAMLQIDAFELERKVKNIKYEIRDAILAEEARLQPKVDALDKEIKTTALELEEINKKLQGLSEIREGHLTEEKDLLDNIIIINNSLKEAESERNRLENEPDRVKKHYNIVQKALLVAQKELKTLDENMMLQLTKIGELQTQKVNINTQLCMLAATSKSNLSDINTKESTLHTLLTNLQFEQEHQRKSQGHIIEIENLIKAAAVAFNKERDLLAQTIQLKEIGLREFKRIEQAKADVRNNCDNYKGRLESLNREASRIKEMRDKLSRELSDKKMEVDILINQFHIEELSKEKCIKDIEDAQENIKSMEDQLREREAEDNIHQVEINELTTRRQDSSRVRCKSIARINLINNEVHIKEGVLATLKRRHCEISTRYSLLIDEYKLIKRERCYKASQIQSASQRMNEIHEKIKVIDNEFDVLRKESLQKDHELFKKSRESQTLRQLCKNLTMCINKEKDKLSYIESEELDIKNRMKKLNTLITKTEDEMLNMKKKYEDTVENRNYAGIHLIDCNDELCILYEKANVQEGILKEGNRLLNKRTEEIVTLGVRLSDIQRQLDLCQRILPQVRALEGKLSRSLLLLEDEKLRAEVLDNDITDPDNNNRWRRVGSVTNNRCLDSGVLSGKSGGGIVSSSANNNNNINNNNININNIKRDQTTPTHHQESKPTSFSQSPSKEYILLQKQVQELENKVESVEEKLLETDIILEEVTNMSNIIQIQASNGHELTFELARRVGGYQTGIKIKTKKMMAALSELSIMQSSAIQLESEVGELEDIINTAKERVSSNNNTINNNNSDNIDNINKDIVAPTEYFEYKYEKDKTDKKRWNDVIKSRKERLSQQDQYSPLSSSSLDNNNNNNNNNNIITPSSQYRGMVPVSRTTAEKRPNAYIPDGELGIPLPYGGHPPFKPNTAAKYNCIKYYGNMGRREGGVE